MKTILKWSGAVLTETNFPMLNKLLVAGRCLNYVQQCRGSRTVVYVTYLRPAVSPAFSRIKSCLYVTRNLGYTLPS